MAGKGTRKAEQESEMAARYTKKQLAEAEHFHSRRDMIEALLENGRVYTVSEADQVIHEFMKGKVSLC